jgi:hypothetical protein
MRAILVRRATGWAVGVGVDDGALTGADGDGLAPRELGGGETGVVEGDGDVCWAQAANPAATEPAASPLSIVRREILAAVVTRARYGKCARRPSGRARSQIAPLNVSQADGSPLW